MFRALVGGLAAISLMLHSDATLAQPRELHLVLAAAFDAERNGRLHPDARAFDAGMRVGIDIALAAVGESGIVILPATAATPPAGGAAATEPTGATWRFEASGLRHRDSADLDADRLALTWGRRLQAETASVGLLIAAVDRDAETSDAGFVDGEAVRDDDQRRREYNAQVDARWDVHENLWLGVDVAVLGTRFHDGLVRTRADYDVRAVALRAAFAIDEYADGAVVVSRDRYEGEFANSGRREDTWGLRIEHARLLAESTRLRVSAGVRRSSARARATFGASAVRRHGQNRGFLGELSLAHAWSIGDVECRLARTRQPSGIGVQFERDEAALTLRVPLDDVRTATLQATVDRNRVDGDFAEVPEERLWSLRAGFSWQLGAQLEASLQAGFRAQTIAAGAAGGHRRAEGALVQVGFRYTPEFMLL